MAAKDSNTPRDPWGNKNGPPDLDATLQKFLEKLRTTMRGKKSPASRRPKSHKSLKLPNSVGVGIAALSGIVLLFWALSGIFIVGPAEQAVVLRFGQYIKTVGPGPHWIPQFIYSTFVYNVERVSDYSYSAQMLTKDENLVSVSLAVQYRIKDLKDYLFNVSDPEGSLRQATSSALRQVVGNTTLDQIITEGREAWGASVHETLIAILNQYKTGIFIVNVSPQPARAPENVQDAFDDAIKAQEDEKRFKEQAYAYEASVVPIAEGHAKRISQEAEAFAQQVVLQATGQVASFLALLPTYARAPHITAERLYLETMQQVLSRAPKIIVDSKSNNMLYLPLDKLNVAHSIAADNSSLPSPSSPAVTASPLPQLFPDIRPTVRPTERAES